MGNVAKILINEGISEKVASIIESNQSMIVSSILDTVGSEVIGTFFTKESLTAEVIVSLNSMSLNLSADMIEIITVKAMALLGGCNIVDGSIDKIVNSIVSSMLKPERLTYVVVNPHELISDPDKFNKLSSIVFNSLEELSEYIKPFSWQYYSLKEFVEEFNAYESDGIHFIVDTANSYINYVTVLK